MLNFSGNNVMLNHSGRCKSCKKLNIFFVFAWSYYSYNDDCTLAILISWIQVEVNVIILFVVLRWFLGQSTADRADLQNSSKFKFKVGIIFWKSEMF